MEPTQVQLLTVTEAADRLRLSPRTIRRRIADGSLDIVRFGRSIRITETDLTSFIRRHLSDGTK